MGRVNLVGVVELGGLRDAELAPINPRTTLRYTRGSTVTVALSVIGSTGEPVDLTTATGGSPTASLEFTVKASSLEDESILKVVGTVVGDPLMGQVEFAIPSTAFKFHDPGRYAYDIWLLRLTERDCVLPTSPFVVEPTLRSV